MVKIDVQAVSTADIEYIARGLLDEMRVFFEDQKNVERFESWKEKRGDLDDL